VPSNPGWTVTTLPDPAQPWPILRRSFGSLHSYQLPSSVGHASELSVDNSTDISLLNLGEFTLGINGNATWLQSANFGAATPVQHQLFGEFSGQSSLLDWPLQFGA
jgi:hypothetical protein